jgi:quinol-cytochrome oxidoreductase complex cytochrome b subunit
LPWDQKAYWAAGGHQPVGTVPDRSAWPGSARGDDSRHDARRFFAIHVIFLPWMIAVFVALHLFILRRVGPAGPWDKARAKARSEPFYPKQIAMDAVAMGVAFLALALWRSWSRPIWPTGRIRPTRAFVRCRNGIFSSITNC